MKIQNIHNQNFNGKLIYTDRISKKAAKQLSLKKIIPYHMELKEAKKAIRKRPFNVYVSYQKDNNDGVFWVEAAKSYKEALKHRYDKPENTAHGSNPIAIPWLIKDAIKYQTNFIKSNI